MHSFIIRKPGFIKFYIVIGIQLIIFVTVVMSFITTLLSWAGNKQNFLIIG